MHSAVTLLYSVIILGIICSSKSYYHRSSFSNLNPSSSSSYYHHEERLGPHGNYQLQWDVSFETKSLLFKVAVKCQGFFALGFSKNGAIARSDFAIGGIHSNGIPYLIDMHGQEDGKLQIDHYQNWKLLAGNRTGEWIYLSFLRNFETSDSTQDITINDDMIYVIWAFGKTNEIVVHRENFGMFKTYLLDPDFVTEAAAKAQAMNVPSDIFATQPWAASAVQKIPAEKTSRICSIIKSPEVFFTRYILGGLKYFAYGENKNHHSVGLIKLSRCSAPEGTNKTVYFEKFANASGSGGMRCQSGHFSVISTKLCAETVFVLGREGKAYYFPSNYGFSFVKGDYFLLEVHHYNPEEVVGLEIKSGLYLEFQLEPPTLTPGIIQIDCNYNGLHDVGAFTIPSSTHYRNQPFSTVFGSCTARSEDHLISISSHEKGFKIYAVLMIMGQYGKRIRLRHFRYNQELPLILEDGNYDFRFQQIRSLREDVTVLSGDEIIIECIYDTSILGSKILSETANHQRNGVEEECLTYLFTNSPNSSCVSSSNSKYYSTKRNEIVPAVPEVSYAEKLNAYSYSPTTAMTTASTAIGNHYWYPSPVISTNYQQQYQLLHLASPRPFQHYHFRPIAKMSAVPITFYSDEYSTAGLSSSPSLPQYVLTPITTVISLPQKNENYGNHYRNDLRRRRRVK